MWFPNDTSGAVVRVRKTWYLGVGSAARYINATMGTYARVAKENAPLEELAMSVRCRATC